MNMQMSPTGPSHVRSLAAEHCCETPANPAHAGAAVLPARPARARCHLPLLPAVMVAILPKCPACAAAYLGVLGSIGARGWFQAAWGLPLASVCLVAALGALGFHAGRRRGYGPLGLGCAGAIVLMLGKFLFELPALSFAGVALLAGAATWNGWPRSQQPRSSVSRGGWIGREWR
jgi:hypothetical protein